MPATNLTDKASTFTMPTVNVSKNNMSGDPMPNPNQDETDTKPELDMIQVLMSHYQQWTEDMERRMLRRNGWNDITDAYMNKLPANWPYNAMVTDPRIRNSMVEKNGRLINAKLQGRLVARKGGSELGARINNALLDYQWDAADNGGPMIEKVQQADQTTRLYGAAWAYCYWDALKECNEMKVWDARDIGLDPSSNHIRNAKWAQLREWTTLDALEAQGYDVSSLDATTSTGMNLRQNSYQDRVKINRSLEDRTGQDRAFPVVEVVTEYVAADGDEPAMMRVFLPKYAEIIYEGENKYKHGRIPLAQLRYYPLGDDFYGESEVEPVLPLQRAINATLCAFLDTMNNAMRPPVKVISGQARIETIEYGPGAVWIMNSPGAVTEAVVGEAAVQQFNATYPMLVAAFNNAMGDQSIGISNVKGYQTDKTATEVNDLAQQQNQRDQYNQVFLGEFLQEVMLFWLSNNQQFLFDDPSKNVHILKIIGKDKIAELQQFELDQHELSDEAMYSMGQTISQAGGVNPDILNTVAAGVQMPSNPVVMNPNELDPRNFDIQSKLQVKGPNEADLNVTPDDIEGIYDYIPDVKSMAQGAGKEVAEGRKNAFEMALNPVVVQGLQMQGETFNMKELVIAILEDNGIKDPESLFITRPQPIPGAGAVPFGPPGQPGAQAGPGVGGLGQQPGVPANTPPMANAASPAGLPQSAPQVQQQPGF